MGRYMLLWLLGVPIPILLLIWAFGGLHRWRSEASLAGDCGTGRGYACG